MGDYQDRKDIDQLYELVWDNENNKTNFITKEELDEAISDIQVEITEKTTYTLIVKFDDSNNIDGFRPTAIQVVSFLNGDRQNSIVISPIEEWVKTVQLDNNGVWTFEFTDVSQYSKEVVKSGTTYVVTYTHKPVVREVNVTVECDDPSLTSIPITLYQNNNVYESRNIGTEGYTFYNLPVWSGMATEYQYTISTSLTGYKISISGSMTHGFIIRISSKAGNLTVTVWSSIEHSSYESDINDLDVVVLRNGELYSRLSYNQVKEKYIFEKVPIGTYTVYLSNANGLVRDCTLIDDSVTLLSMDVEDDGTSYIELFVHYYNENYVEPDPTEERQDIPVKIIWDDGDDADGLRPSQINLPIFVGNDIDVAYVTLNEDNNWSNVYTDLPVYSDATHKINYYWKYSLNGYVTSYEENTIKLTHNFETANLKLVIDWDDDDDSHGVRPSSVDWNLLADNVLISNSKVTSSANWEIAITDCAVNKKGTAINYTWRVTEPTNYIMNSYSTDQDGITTIYLEYWTRPVID